MVTRRVSGLLNAMNTGSDSDSFDEGDLTARGRKAKGKGSSSAKEKGKQKAKDVRSRASDQQCDFLLTAFIAGLRLGGHLYPLLGYSSRGRGWQSYWCCCGITCSWKTTQVRVTFSLSTYLVRAGPTIGFSRPPRRSDARSSDILSSCWTSRHR